MMYRFCCLNKMRSEFTEREEAELLNSHFAPVFLSSEQMRVSIYRDKYIKISHLFIYLFFSNHVHVCFKPLPSGRKEVLGKTYSQSSLGSQTRNPRAMSRLQGADTVEQHGGRGPSGHWASDHTVYTAAASVATPVALSGAAAQVIFSPQNYFGDISYDSFCLGVAHTGQGHVASLGTLTGSRAWPLFLQNPSAYLSPIPTALGTNSLCFFKILCVH